MSAPRELGPARGIEATDSTASWQLPQRGLRVALSLEGPVLAVDFVADVPGRFTWPVVRPGPSARGYVLPLAEGSYVPVDHPVWGEFLERRGPFSTTGGLSMPFWALLGDDCTITYLAVHPFNNALDFRCEDGRIGCGLTHEFTPNWPEKRYRVQVRLGAGDPVEPARQFRQWLKEQGQFVSLDEKIAALPNVEKLLGAPHIYLWGDGFSAEMMDRLAGMGLSRAWLGSDSWVKAQDNPDAVRRARELGYLIGPYDSYNSIHSPDAEETWETAQFDRELYETGPIVGRDGQKLGGFQGSGYLLSPIAARPYVRRRVSRIMESLPQRFNSWFVDCDATGELHDDYSPRHPATQRDDMQARLERMRWISSEHGLVVGSEKGASFAAPVIHFAHGMMTPVFGWSFGTNIRRERDSRYYLGGWWPPDGPARFVQQVPLPDTYRTVFFDPRYRLPLYQAALHDSVVTTHHWEYGSLKFREEVSTVELLELLYNVPPLYHLNIDELDQHEDRIRAHCEFFSPLHRKLGRTPLNGFEWLTPDRTVQRTVFGGKVEMIANFRETAFDYEGLRLGARSVVARWLDSGRIGRYAPEPPQ